MRINGDDDDSITYKQDFVNLKSHFTDVNNSTIHEDSVSSNIISKCHSIAILKVYGKFSISKFTVLAQPKEITYLINDCVSNTTIGMILSNTNFTVPTSLKYTFKDHDGNTVDTSIVYNPVNTRNELDSVDDTAKAVFTSSIGKPSTSVSSTLVTSASSSSIKSSTSKSKSDTAARRLPIQPSIFAMFLSLLL